MRLAERHPAVQADVHLGGDVAADAPRDPTMSRISFSVSSGSDCSVSSPMLGPSRSQATFTSIAPTTMEATGSSTVQRSPRKMAPAIPMAAPMDERASER